MKVSAQYAEAHFADILNAAYNGEEVEIALPDKPPLKLVVSTSSAFTPKPGRRILGAGRGEMVVPSWEEWKAMDNDLEREINEAPLVSGDV
jgi:antitoxin (DNA-binding transcriptional repressor) of toxin-antitoxin stability system